MYTPPVNQPYLPGVSWKTPASPVAKLSDLNAVASDTQETQAQVLGENAPLRIGYGEHPLGAQVATGLIWNNNLVMLLVWEEGPIEQIVSVKVNGETLPAGITLIHYHGLAGQTADPTMVSAFAAQGITYTDTLPGIAYTVALIPPNVTSGWPNFVGQIKGRLLYDPRLDSTAGGTGAHRANDSATWTYSDNPALALGDFEASTLYGQGRTVNAASLIAAADFCDEMVGMEKRRAIGLAIDTVNTCDQWQEALRTYAGCFVSQEGAECVLVPDKPGSVEFSFTASNVQKITRMVKRGTRQVPTVMEVRYTDKTSWPWKEKTATAYASGVLSGATPRRISRVSLPGVTSHSQAMREAIERLNKLTLCDLYLEFDAFDECLKLRMGAIVDITHPRGLTAKKLRIMDIRVTRPGRWNIAALEYDPESYSDVVTATPTFPDTTLPSAAAPPAIAGGITAVEEVFQLENGSYSSRIKTTWPATTYPYLDAYRIEIYQAGNLILTSSQKEVIFRSHSVQDGLEYVVKVAVIASMSGAVGDWAQANITAAGKSLIPGDVPSVSAYEAGGRVFGTCGAAADIDIAKYEWRYWPAAGSWETGTMLDRRDSLTIDTSTIPVGAWVLGVKAMDSVVKPGATVGQYSANAATCPVTVTSDSAAFLVDTYDQTAPTLTNMAEYSLGRTDTNRYFVTDDGVAWDTKFPNAMDTYTNPLSTYHGSVTSTWLGEAEDFGQLLGGDWTGEAAVADISGTHISSLGFSPNNTDWTYLSGLSQKTNARFARMKHEALTTSTLQVTIPGQRIRLNAVPREEVSAAAVTSSATSAKTVFLANQYASTKKIGITVLGTTAANHVEDNIGHNEPSPVDKHANLTVTGNVITKTVDGWVSLRARHPLPTTGKWRWRTAVTVDGGTVIGVLTRSGGLGSLVGNDAAGWGYLAANGYLYHSGGSAYGAAYTTGAAIEIRYDADASELEFFKNGVGQGVISGVSGDLFPAWSAYGTASSLLAQFTETDMGSGTVDGFLPLPYAFDEHIFDTAGARVARDFLWSHQGV